MKLALLIIAVSLSSCTYQYFVLSGNELSKNENNDFVVENDTLKVTYCFSGDHGPVKITIYNKTGEPLEVNWRKSALVMNDKAYGYYSPNLFVNGSIQQDTAKRFFYGSRSLFADVKADIYVNEPSQFIPPRSSISKIPLSLPVHSLILPLDQLKKESYTTATNYRIKYSKSEYTPEKSPVAFRSYLSFNYGGSELKEFSIDHRFYVSEIWQSSSSPTFIPREIAQRGNFFHVRS